MRTVLVVIPTYNEAQNIPTLLEGVFKTQSKLSEYDVKVLVVDDSSPDGTGELVRKWSKKNRKLHLLTGKKAGLGSAYLRGFKHAVKRFDPYAVVMMDADMSHDPSAIPSLLAALESGADYVIGSRYIHGGTIPGNWPLLRIVNSRVANFLARTLVGISGDILDLTGGFKAMRCSALKKALERDISASGYVFQVSLLQAFLSQKSIVKEVPIRFVDRKYGISKLRTRDILEFIYRAYHLNPQSPIRRMLRFALVGASGAVVNIGALFVLVHALGLGVLVSAAFAIEVSIISNFFMNEYYTFRIVPEGSIEEGFGESLKPDKSARDIRIPVRLAQFNAGALVGAGISFTVLTLLYSKFGMNYLLADVVAIATAMSWNYWMSTRLIWQTAHD